MDLTGLTLKLIDSAVAIDFGRKGYATRGKAEEGRLSYEGNIKYVTKAHRRLPKYIISLPHKEFQVFFCSFMFTEYRRKSPRYIDLGVNFGSVEAVCEDVFLIIA